MFCCWVSQHLQLTGKLNTIPVADTIQLRGFYYYFFKYTNWKPCVFSVTVASTDLTGRLIESLSKVGHKNILSLCEQVFPAHFTGSNFCLCLLAALTQLKIEICSPCLVFSRCNCSFFFFSVSPPVCLLFFNVTPAPSCRALQAPASLFNVIIKKLMAPETWQHQFLFQMVDLGGFFTPKWVPEKPWFEPGPNPELFLVQFGLKQNFWFKKRSKQQGRDARRGVVVSGHPKVN